MANINFGAYIIDTDNVSCTCPDFKYRRSRYALSDINRRCKHIRSVFESIPDVVPDCAKGINPYLKGAGIQCPDGKIRYNRIAFQQYVDDLTNFLVKYTGSGKIIKKFEFTGSWRRMAPLVSDLDVLIVLNDSKTMDPIYNYLEEFMSYVKLWRGEKKASYKIDELIQIDFKCVPESSWAFALTHYTGPKMFNIECRRRALAKGFSLSEYGLKNGSGDLFTDFTTEEQIMDWLGMRYLTPMQRQSYVSY